MSLPKRLREAWKKFKEVPDPTPHSLAVRGLKRPMTLEEQVARAVRFQRFVESLNVAGHETFEESNDFEIPDDPDDPKTPWEEDYYGKFEEEVAMEKQLYEHDPKAYDKRKRRPFNRKKQAQRPHRDDVRNQSRVSSSEQDIRDSQDFVQELPKSGKKQQSNVHST